LSVIGISAAVALLMVGLVMFDAMDRLIENQFWVAERQDAAITFTLPRSSDVRHELARLPGVLAVEPQRAVAARVRSAHRQRYLPIIGIHDHARLQRIVAGDGEVFRVPASGVALSRALAEILDVDRGDEVQIDVLEGTRPQRSVTVTEIVDDVLGLSIYMEMSQLHRLLREDDTVTSAMILFDPAMERPLLRALKDAPAVAGVSLKRSIVRAFRDTMAGTMNVTIAVNVLFAAIVAAGVVYNAARVALSERSRDLASLRVLGYTRGEISLMLLSEIALLTVLALPLGVVFGHALCVAVFSTVQSEVYRFPLIVSPSAAAWACLFVLAAATIASLAVRRRLDRLDLIAVLKVQE
jgi:putative ABC transport system permease protein